MLGTYMVPLKKWPKFSNWAYMSLMTFGALVSALVVACFTHTLNLNFVGIICGLLWVVGGAFCFWAVQAEDDLAGAGVRSMGMSILASFLSGVIIFGENSSFLFSIPAIICFMFGLSRLCPTSGGSILKNWRSFLGGFFFGTYLIPFKLYVMHGAELSDLEFICPFTIGLFIGTQILVFIIKLKSCIKFQKLPCAASAISGILWMIGTHGCFWAINANGELGYAVGYPLTQLNLLVNLGWGVLIFGEYKSTRERMRLMFATAIILAGAVLLTLSKR